MPGFVNRETKQSFGASFIYVQLNKGARVQVIERQSSTPLAQNGGGQWLTLNVYGVKIQVRFRLPQYRLHFRHQAIHPDARDGKLRRLRVLDLIRED